MNPLTPSYDFLNGFALAFFLMLAALVVVANVGQKENAHPRLTDA